MKKIIALALALVMVFSLAAVASAADLNPVADVATILNGHDTTGLNNFKTMRSYPAGKFTDVDRSAWYLESVTAAYELRLVEGTSATTYSPDKYVTVAETITLAARMHSIYYTGSENITGTGAKWYDKYVKYAINHGLIGEKQFINYDAYATRAQFALIMWRSLPSEALQAINNITFLPDVDLTMEYGQAVLSLYNAGVLVGNDKFGTFSPFNNIRRSEVAAIVTRMAKVELRKSFVLDGTNTLTESVRTTMLSLLTSGAGYLGDAMEIFAQIGVNPLQAPALFTEMLGKLTLADNAFTSALELANQYTALSSYVAPLIGVTGAIENILNAELGTADIGTLMEVAEEYVGIIVTLSDGVITFTYNK